MLQVTIKCEGMDRKPYYAALVGRCSKETEWNTVFDIQFVKCDAVAIGLSEAMSKSRAYGHPVFAVIVLRGDSDSVAIDVRSLSRISMDYLHHAQTYRDAILKAIKDQFATLNSVYTATKAEVNS